VPPDPIPEATRVAVSLAAMRLSVNGTPRTFDRPVLTVADVIRELALEGKRIAVEKNGEIVPRSLYADTSVDGSDRLEIVGAVGGG
jgi:sulfur carrier protein